MPSIIAYSPYETLAFFQSVAQHGHNASAFQDISRALKQNEFIRDGANFHVDRFSADALQNLYKRYIGLENSARNSQVNGDEGQPSPKRRKLSNSPQPRDGNFLPEEQQLQDLVEKLYSKFKDECIREIREDEDVYRKLQEDIHALELIADTEMRQPNELTPSSTSHPSKSKVELDGKPNIKATGLEPPSRPASALEDSKPPNDIQTVPAEAPSINLLASQRQEAASAQPSQQHARISQASALPTQGLSPNSFPRQVPSPSPQRPTYGPIQTQSVYSPNQAPQGSMLSQVHSGQQRSHARSHQSGSQNRSSPIPYQAQHPYPPYPQYPTHQWQPQMPLQQYQQHSTYGPPQPYYSPTPTGRHPQTPQQIPYASYPPHTAPLHYVPQQQQWRQHQWPAHHISSVTTPISRPDSWQSPIESGSSTPWKRKQQQTQMRAKSPPRPEREVSPLTDHDDSPLPVKSSSQSKIGPSKRNESQNKTQPPPRRRGRPPSSAPSAVVQSRSQSIASRTSDLLNDNDRSGATRRGQVIKAEPPSTPLPVSYSDTEQRSSGRRGRPRGSTVTSHADGPNTTLKRKRDTLSPTSPVRSPEQTLANSTSYRIHQKHDPALIVVSKNFAKTSQLLLSEITSHKLAGIFAKPLSERDAPGYKDLILRPQDLKSIKAAISKGGRAALAAIEAIEGDGDATPTKVQQVSTSPTVLGSIGNGFYLVPKCAELVPPKGIINSAQLEMELVRMFANAIMFNPLTASESGFGRNLRLRKNGGDVNVGANPEEMSASEESESGSSLGFEDGGIISDAREMFNDVVEMVGKWRELEGERMMVTADTNPSRNGSLAMPTTTTGDLGRQLSVSANSNVAEDETLVADNDTANTPTAITASGPGRKRRRIAE